MSGIEIRNFEADEDTYFSIKDFRFKNTALKTPFKCLDFNDLKTVKEISSLDRQWLNKNNFIEKSHIVKQDTFLKEADRSDAPFLSKNYDSYKKIPVLSDKSIINTLTLSFNPCLIHDYEDYLDSFLDIYHGRSDLLFVPNLKVKEFDKDNNKSEVKIQPDDYLDYVQCAYDSLKFRNSKPIFVPVSTRYGVKPSAGLILDLLESGFRYFWLDLEGRASTSIAPIVRSFHRVVDKQGLDDKIILYGSNIRREINPNKKDSISAASDVLATPIGFDFIGVNRDTQKTWFGNNYIPPPQELTTQHKGRLFDSENYEYVKFSEFKGTDDLLKKYHLQESELIEKPAFFSDFINSYELNMEFERQRYAMQYDKSLRDYLEGKRSITEKILKSFDKDKSSKNNKNSYISLNDFM